MVNPGPHARRAPRPPDLATTPAVDDLQVLIAGHSRVTRVVVSRIVERSGLRPHSVTPAEAEKALGAVVPGVLIVDGGSDNHECDGLLASVARLRQVRGAEVPAVILLSNVNGTPRSLGLDPVVDEVVTKPLTTEHLQPVVDRLAVRARSVAP